MPCFLQSAIIAEVIPSGGVKADSCDPQQKRCWTLFLTFHRCQTVDTNRSKSDEPRIIVRGPTKSQGITPLPDILLSALRTHAIGSKEKSMKLAGNANCSTFLAISGRFHVGVACC